MSKLNKFNKDFISKPPSQGKHAYLQQRTLETFFTNQNKIWNRAGADLLKTERLCKND